VDHAGGNYRVLATTLAAELLNAAVDLSRLP
jgi:hypothetical protein